MLLAREERLLAGRSKRYLLIAGLVILGILLSFLWKKSFSVQRGYEKVSEGYVKDLRYGVQFPEESIKVSEKEVFPGKGRDSAKNQKQKYLSKNSKRFIYIPLTPKILVNSKNPFLARIHGRIEDIDKKSKTITFLTNNFKAIKVNEENYRPINNEIYQISTNKGLKITATYDSSLLKKEIRRGDLVVATLRFEPEENKGKVFVAQLMLFKDLISGKKQAEKKGEKKN